MVLIVFFCFFLHFATSSYGFSCNILIFFQNAEKLRGRTERIERTIIVAVRAGKLKKKRTFCTRAEITLKVETPRHFEFIYSNSRENGRMVKGGRPNGYHKNFPKSYPPWAFILFVMFQILKVLNFWISSRSKTTTRNYYLDEFHPSDSNGNQTEKHVENS